MIKLLLPCIFLFAGMFVLADEAADRTAVEQTVFRLSSVLRVPRLFSADFDGYPDLQRLSIQMLTVPVRVIPPSRHVIISKEPWGEATWDIGSVVPAISSVSRFVIKSVHFVTPDVAVVEAVCEQFEPSVANERTSNTAATHSRTCRFEASRRDLPGHIVPSNHQITRLVLAG